MNYIGHVILKSPLFNTQNPWGPNSDLKGPLPVMEKNKEGDCLCMVYKDQEPVGIVDVKASDVAIFIPKHVTEALKTEIKILGLKKAGVIQEGEEEGYRLGLQMMHDPMNFLKSIRAWSQSLKEKKDDQKNS